MTWKDFLQYIFHTDLHISSAPLFQLPISLLPRLLRALWQNCVRNSHLKCVRMSHHLLTCQQTGISWSGSAGTGCDSYAWSDSSHSSHTSCSWCSAGCSGGKIPDEEKKAKGEAGRQKVHVIQLIHTNDYWPNFPEQGAYLATLACMHSIVETRCNVTTHFTKQDHSTCFWGERVSRQLDQ